MYFPTKKTTFVFNDGGQFTEVSMGDIWLFMLKVSNDDEIHRKEPRYRYCNCEAEIKGFIRASMPELLRPTQTDYGVIIFAQPIGESVKFAGNGLRIFTPHDLFKPLVKLCSFESDESKTGVSLEPAKDGYTLSIATSIPEYPIELLDYNVSLNDNKEPCKCI